MYKKYILFAALLFILAAAALVTYQVQGIRRFYKTEAEKGLERTPKSGIPVLTENDIKDLPEPVQKYIRYTGAIGKEKVFNYKVVFDGAMKMDQKKGWSKITAEQYSFTDNTSRLYFINGNFFGIPAIGIDSYLNGKGGMLIKLGGLVKVVDAKSEEMNQGALVTLFNDMCLLAPSTLIDNRIQWETIDSRTVKATFENSGIKVSATLYFNEEGQMINFVTDDRFYSPTGKTYQKVRWSTQVKNYREYNGIKLASYGEATWHFPEGDYNYARATIMDVKYNCKNFE